MAVSSCSLLLPQAGARLLRCSRVSWRQAGPQGRPHHIGRQRHRLQCAAQISTSPPEGLSALPWTGSDAELKALEQLQQQMASCEYGVPDTETLKWFLRDRKFDVEEAERKLTSMLRWRSDLGLSGLTLDDIAEEDKVGKAYVHEHADRAGRPVLVIRVARHKLGEFPLDASQQLCNYYVETALSRLPPPTESILGIFDLRGFGPSNADLGFAKFMIDCFFTYYPKRVSQVLMVDAPWIFQPTYQLVKPMLGKYSALVRFVTRKELAVEYFTPETLPEEFSS